MKRGNFLLLVFALSLFSISVFSFLPMVSGTHCTATSEETCYSDPDGMENVEDAFYVCGGNGKHIDYHYCSWDSDTSVCTARYFEMFDCDTIRGPDFCDIINPYLTSDETREAIRYYSGYCTPGLYTSEGYTNGNAGCEIITDKTCKSDEYCTEKDTPPIPGDYIDSIKRHECIEFEAAEDTPIEPTFADETDEGTAEAGVGPAETDESLAGGYYSADEETSDAGMWEPAEFWESKPLMFKTILAILLVALILAALIYF